MGGRKVVQPVRRFLMAGSLSLLNPYPDRTTPQLYLLYRSIYEDFCSFIVKTRIYHSCNSLEKMILSDIINSVSCRARAELRIIEKGKKMKNIAYILFFLVVSGCASNTDPLPTQSNLTAGMAKKAIVKGQTTQAEVMEIFGPPDLLTHKNNMQIWTYDKIRYDVESSDGYLNVLVAGIGGRKSHSSSTSTMLIIYFDSNDKVADYRMSVTRF